MAKLSSEKRKDSSFMKKNSFIGLTPSQVATFTHAFSALWYILKELTLVAESKVSPSKKQCHGLSMFN